MKNQVVAQTSIRITRGNRQRKVEVRLIRLPCDEELDRQRGIRAFRSIFIDNDNIEETTWYVNNLQTLKEHFTLKIQKLVNKLNPNKDTIKVLEDKGNLITFQSGYCQHCKKKLLESYGPAFGVLKKCRNCGNLSFIRDENWIRRFSK